MAGSLPGDEVQEVAVGHLDRGGRFLVLAPGDGAGAVLDDRLPVSAARAGDPELEDHVHPGRLFGLEGLGIRSKTDWTRRPSAV